MLIPWAATQIQETYCWMRKVSLFLLITDLGNEINMSHGFLCWERALNIESFKQSKLTVNALTKQMGRQSKGCLFWHEGFPFNETQKAYSWDKFRDNDYKLQCVWWWPCERPVSTWLFKQRITWLELLWGSTELITAFIRSCFTKNI